MLSERINSWLNEGFKHPNCLSNSSPTIGIRPARNPFFCKMPSVLSRPVEAPQKFEVPLNVWMARSLCESFYLDPRHLEANAYGLWNELLHTLATPSSPTGRRLRIVQPQCAAWISELQDPAVVPTLSQRTIPDSTALGVYTDFAIIFIVEDVAELPSFIENNTVVEFEGKSLQWFFTVFLPAHPDFDPACLYPIGMRIPLLLELKPGPFRNARDLAQFFANLRGRLRRAMSQVMRQSYFVFKSWCFVREDSIILIAGAGDYFVVRRITRSWADKYLRLEEIDEDAEEGGEEWNPQVESEAPSASAAPVASSSRQTLDGDDNECDQLERQLQALNSLGPSQLKKQAKKIETLWRKLEAARRRLGTGDERASMSDVNIQQLRTTTREALATLRELDKQIAAAQATLNAAESRRRHCKTAAARARHAEVIAETTANLGSLKDNRAQAITVTQVAARQLGRSVRPAPGRTVPNFLSADLDLYFQSYTDSDEPFSKHAIPTSSSPTRKTPRRSGPGSCASAQNSPESTSNSSAS